MSVTMYMLNYFISLNASVGPLWVYESDLKDPKASMILTVLSAPQSRVEPGRSHRSQMEFIFALDSSEGPVRCGISITN